MGNCLSTCTKSSSETLCKSDIKESTGHSEVTVTFQPLKSPPSQKTVVVSNNDEIRDIVQQELAALQAQIKHSQAVLASLGTKASKRTFGPGPAQIHRTTQTLQQESQPRSLECIVMNKLSQIQQEWCSHELASSCPAIVSTVSIAVQTENCKNKVSLPEIDFELDSEITSGRDFFLPPISPLDMKLPDSRPLASSSGVSYEPRSHDLELDIYRSCRKLSVLPEEEISEMPPSPHLAMLNEAHQAHSFESYLHPCTAMTTGPVRQLSDPTPSQNIASPPRASTRRPLQILQTPQAQFFHFPDSFETDSGLESKPTCSGSRSSPGDSEDRVTSPTYGILQDTVSQLVSYSPPLTVQSLEVPPLQFFSPTPDTTPYKTPPEGFSIVQTPEYSSTPHSEISETRKKSVESTSETLSFQTLSDNSPGNVNNPMTSPSSSPEPDHSIEIVESENATIISDLNMPSKLTVKPLHSMLSVLMDSKPKSSVPGDSPSEQLTRVPSRRRLTRSLMRVSSQTPLELVEFREPLPVVPVSGIAESSVVSEAAKEASSDIKLPDSMKNEHKDAKGAAVMKRSLSEIGDSNGTMKKTLLTSQSFPTLSDHVLRQLGLWLEEKKPAVSDVEEQSEKEVENSFMALLLAFQTDRLTLTSRLELQTRLRDQAEQNMANEIQQLQNIVMKLSDRSEYLTDVHLQIDNLHKAALRVSSAAEIYGAVQQENRLSKAVDVILRHVENLKEAFNKEQSEHVETKRVLLESKPINNAQVSVKPSCRRRATIAVGVAQNGTNLTHDIIIPANSLETKISATIGQTRQRYSLSQRGSAGKIETIQDTEKQNENAVEGKLERRSSLNPNYISIHAEESNWPNYSCNSDTNIDSDVGEESDGSVQDSSPVPSTLKGRRSLTFSLQLPDMSWSMDEFILHARYGLAAALLLAAFAVFCSTLYS